MENPSCSEKKRKKWRSGNIYCAANCSSREKRDPFKFYRIPKEKKRRSAWLRAISLVEVLGNRKVQWKPSKNSRLCSKHFESGRKSNNPLSPNYLPKLFSHKTPKLRQERRTRVSRKLFGETSNDCERYLKVTKFCLCRPLNAESIFFWGKSALLKILINK